MENLGALILPLHSTFFFSYRTHPVLRSVKKIDTSVKYFYSSVKIFDTFYTFKFYM